MPSVLNASQVLVSVLVAICFLPAVLICRIRADFNDVIPCGSAPVFNSHNCILRDLAVCIALFIDSAAPVNAGLNYNCGL
jgi:hypothetical protein